MYRTLPAVVCAFAIVVLLGSWHGTAVAAAPEASAPKSGMQAFNNSLPFLIGGVITLGVLGLGLIFLGGKQQSTRAPAHADADPLYEVPSHVVPAANPLRYLVMPAILLLLLAVLVPLGYEIWTNLPDGNIKLPARQDLGIEFKSTIDWSKMKPIELPTTPTFKTQPFQPPTIHIPQPPPPVPVPVFPPPQPRHR
jgi:hypothetical protein